MGSVVASSINILEVDGETLVWHTGLPGQGEDRTSPPFSYGGRKWCLRFLHRYCEGFYHSIMLHRLDADGEREEKVEDLTHRFRVHVHMQHLMQGDKVVGDVEDWVVCETSTYLWGFGEDSDEAIFRRLGWLRDRPEVKFACRFSAPPTIPTDKPVQKEEDLTESSQSSDVEVEPVPRDDAKTLAEDSQSTVNEDPCPHISLEATNEGVTSSEKRDASIQTDGEFGRAEALAEESDTSEKQAADEVLGSLQSLYQRGEGCDVVLKVGGKEFQAHKVILQMRSPVFRAMFDHKMLENQQNSVTIEDLDQDAIPSLLQHIYTGSIRMISTSNVFSLFMAADKYDLRALRRGCSQFMRRNMTVTSFCDVFRIALKHGEQELVEHATEFFCSNSLAIVETPEWQIFLDENPTAGNELVIKLLSKHKNIFGARN